MLLISHSSGSDIKQRSTVEKLVTNLLWMAFHLGSVGQGARRPLYSRKNRDRAPWWRGSTLIAYLYDDCTPEEENFWDLPSDTRQFAQLFQQRLRSFYGALSELCGRQIGPNNLQAIGNVTATRWEEVADSSCRILVCAGTENHGKPYALSLLHAPQFKVNNDYDGNLCGRVRGGKVQPSPVWISNPDKKYQVVTVFGATQNPRRQFVDELIEQQAIQIFPLPQRR